MAESHPAIDLVLVDFDDTLVDTAPRFERARAELFRLLAAAGFDEQAARTLHHDEIDPAMRARYGFGPQRLGHAFRATYDRLCQDAQRAPDPTLTAMLQTLGGEVVGTPPLIAGSLAALQRLSERLHTVLYTQSGDPDYQLSCVRGAGVLDLLPIERVHVCAHKTRAAFGEVLRLYDVHDPGRAWMVGNSVRSDINPALEAGANAILVEMENPWTYDVVDPVHEQFARVPSFAAAVDLLLRYADGS